METLEKRSLFLQSICRDISQNPNFNGSLSVYYAEMYDNYEKFIALRNKAIKLYITTN